jgi:YD repeat-containing protein
MGTSASATYIRDFGLDSVRPSSRDAESATLSYSAGAYSYLTQDGTLYTFNPNVTVDGAPAPTQRVASITYANGRRLNFSYNASRQLKLVTDSNGYSLAFDYNSSGLVSAACGFNSAQVYASVLASCTGAGLKTTYSYTSGRLTGVTDVTGQTTSLAYSGDNMTCITPPGASGCKIANTYGNPSGWWQVTKQVTGDGKEWIYAPNAGAPNVRDPDYYPSLEPNGGSSFTDPDGKTTHFAFVQTSPYTIQDPLGRPTQFRFIGGFDYEGPSNPNSPPADIHEGSLLIEAVLPEGNKYLAEYNGPYNSLSKQIMRAKETSGLADRERTFGYDCSSGRTRAQCTKPIWAKDPKLNQTDFAYASHGGVTSEMQPAPSTGAARPLKLYTYVQKYAYVKNAGGALVPAASPVWLLSTETLCQTAAGSSTPTCDPSATQTVTTYEYGPDGTANNLLPRAKVVSSGGVSRRTCTAYDAQGNALSGTQALGTTGMTSCP